MYNEQWYALLHWWSASRLFRMCVSPYNLSSDDISLQVLLNRPV
uniref:Rap-GAP domain-containing protein n=1 Tax=Parascaris univalens TaxID=6257 RepID=A0A915AQW5_PARUN